MNNIGDGAIHNGQSTVVNRLLEDPKTQEIVVMEVLLE